MKNCHNTNAPLFLGSFKRTFQYFSKISPLHANIPDMMDNTYYCMEDKYFKHKLILYARLFGF